jgi:hypothetical protein
MRQGWVSMAPAIEELERVIIGRKLRHGGHPVLRWNFENIAIETDKAGNKSFHKGKSRTESTAPWLAQWQWRAPRRVRIQARSITTLKSDRPGCSSFERVPKLLYNPAAR